MVESVMKFIEWFENEINKDPVKWFTAIILTGLGIGSFIGLNS